MWWSGRTKGFKRTRKIDFRVARVATSKKCQKMPLRVARIMPKCYLENGKSYQKNSTLWWSGRTKGFKIKIKINFRVARLLRVATSKKCQKGQKCQKMPKCAKIAKNAKTAKNDLK